MHNSSVLPTNTMPPGRPPLGFQPNIVFILTDDQDRLLGHHGYSSLGSLEIMPIVRRRLLGEGAVVENFYVNTPICCPSRTEFFTGRYFHNVGPPNDMHGKCMHADTSTVMSNTTGLFGILNALGYNVGVFGKVTNDQQRILDEAVARHAVAYIDAPIDYNNYTGATYYRMFPNGTTFTETLDASRPIFGTAYQTTQVGNRTLRWLEGAIAASARAPFFAYIGPHAPHFPATPAPWYEGAFDEVTAPITPNYNLSSPGKAQHVRQNPPLSARVRCWENQHFRDRWRSLLSVDDLVGDVYSLLSAKGALERTYILYSSDHGYKQGQWRIGTSKQHPYETDIRVPFIIRGPGIASGANYTSQISGNVDVMPTILDLAAGEDFAAAVGMDGRSMAGFLIPSLGGGGGAAIGGADADGRGANGKEGGVRPRRWRDAFLSEYLSVGTYYNDHSTVWEDDGRTTAQCGGAMPCGPNIDVCKGAPADPCKESSGVGDGNCWFVDSTHSNSWRQLRILNASMNWNYVEYDPSWRFDVSGHAGLQHYELYDVAADPYQVDNIYPKADEGTRAALHTQLATYWQCRGTGCP